VSRLVVRLPPASSVVVDHRATSSYGPVASRSHSRSAVSHLLGNLDLPPPTALIDAAALSTGGQTSVFTEEVRHTLEF